MRTTASRLALWTGTSGVEDEQPWNESTGAEQEAEQLISGGGKNKTQRDGGSSMGGQEERAGQYKDVLGDQGPVQGQEQQDGEEGDEG